METKIQGAGNTKIKSFTDLDAWKEAHKLTILVYRTTAHFPQDERYGLTSQLRRSIVSTESNIAEGFNRYHFGERINFYYDARGSLGEAQSQLITSKDLGFLGQKDFKNLWNQTTRVDIILNGLITKTRSFKRR
jgi:four helix bundle protein